MSASDATPADVQALFRALDARRCAGEVLARLALLGLALALALRGPIWTAPLAFLAIGVLQYHFLVLSHEAQHLLIARSRRLNDWIGAWCFAYPFGQPFRSERARHLAHHRLVGDPADPDYHRYVTEDKRPWGSMLLYFLRLGTYGKVLEYLTSALGRGGEAGERSGGSRAVGELGLVASVQLVLLALFSIAASPWHYLFFWALPLATLSVVLSEFREFCEHLSAPSTPSRLKSFRCGPLERHLLGPVGFSWHAEHHWYPGIPHYRLGDVAARFPESTDTLEVHPSYFEVLRLCRQSWPA